MSKLVETLHGKRSKFEIYRREKLTGYEFWIYKDGEYWKGSFNTLAAAVDYLKDHGHLVSR